MKLKYMVSAQLNLNGLEGAVNQLIGDGWEPFGGMSVCIDEKGKWFYQALIFDPIKQPSEG